MPVSEGDRKRANSEKINDTSYISRVVVDVVFGRRAQHKALEGSRMMALELEEHRHPQFRFVNLVNCLGEGSPRGKAIVLQFYQ